MGYKCSYHQWLNSLPMVHAAHTFRHAGKPCIVVCGARYTKDEFGALLLRYRNPHCADHTFQRLARQKGSPQSARA